MEKLTSAWLYGVKECLATTTLTNPPITSTPNEGEFLALEAGGVYTGELACNRADSGMRDPVRNDVQPDHACGVSLFFKGSFTILLVL
jgi:hypothetical protein